MSTHKDVRQTAGEAHRVQIILSFGGHTSENRTQSRQPGALQPTSAPNTDEPLGKHSRFQGRGAGKGSAKLGKYQRTEDNHGAVINCSVCEDPAEGAGTPVKPVPLMGPGGAEVLKSRSQSPVPLCPPLPPGEHRGQCSVALTLPHARSHAAHHKRSNCSGHDTSDEGEQCPNKRCNDLMCSYRAAADTGNRALKPIQRRQTPSSVKR
uniref:Uncharacterized protein n=1 Tax=Knipowitschia caucasica TaxID=637954 RepID=A0AAV2K815_KNICA